MPGVAQVWLTREELDALLLAAPTRGTRVSDGLWENIEPKLTASLYALGCPVPQVDVGGLSDVA